MLPPPPLPPNAQAVLTFLPAGSPVRTSVLRVSGRGLTASAADSGQKCFGLSAKPGLFGLWLRTSVTCGLAARTGFSLTWNRLATPAGRSWWVLTKRERRTSGSGSGLWPTPASSQTYKPVRPLAPSEANGTHGIMLVGAVGAASPDLIGTYLNPEWLEFLMGYPIGWTDLKDLETP